MKQGAASNEVIYNQALFLHTKRASMWPHTESAQQYYKLIMTSDKQV